MKKFFAFGVLLTLVLLVMPAAAASPPAISVESIRGDVGETVDVPVSISQNPGLSGFVLWLEFDPDYLEPVAVTRSELLASGLFMDNLADERQLLSSVNVTWADQSNFTGDGVLYTISFLITRELPGGSVDLLWNTQRSNASNGNLELVDIPLGDGQVLSAAAESPESALSAFWILPPLVLAILGTGLFYLRKRSKQHRQKDLAQK